uniref:Core shell protein Gag P30 domain-containing protein n=1 Tax=Cyanoderma ruficeps TaxID=181631 RepID=A0A8C3QQW0_9PASS
MEKLKGVLGGNPPIPRSSPLGCLLAHWKEGNFGQELRKDKLIDYCNVWWPDYVLSDNQRWPENGPSTSNPTPLTLTPPDTLTPPPLTPIQNASPGYPPPPPTPAQRFIPPPTPPQGYPPLPPTPTTPAPIPSGPLNPSPLESTAVSFPGNNLDLAVERERRGRGCRKYRTESSDSEEDGLDAPVAHRTRGRLAPAWPRTGKSVLKTGKQKRTIIAPLRQGVGADGPVFVKVPFSPADLVIWKQSAGTYRDNPDKVARVVKMIMKTQNPDWKDIQVILDTLMDETERDMVLRAARERAREDIRNGLVTGTVDYNFPTEDPEWDPNDPSGVDMLRLKKYQEWICIGVQTAIPRSVNWSKLYEIRQEKKESPSAFLERLKETARKYTDLQIDSEQARVQLAFIFIGQSQEDIRKKLQKLEGGELRNLDKLLEVAWKVNLHKGNNRNFKFIGNGRI